MSAARAPHDVTDDDQATALDHLTWQSNIIKHANNVHHSILTSKHLKDSRKTDRLLQSQLPALGESVNGLPGTILHEPDRSNQPSPKLVAIYLPFNFVIVRSISGISDLTW